MNFFAIPQDPQLLQQFNLLKCTGFPADITTYKSAVVIWLAEQLKSKGLRAGVVSRGYGGKADVYPLLLNETTSTAEAGDEPRH